MRGVNLFFLQEAQAYAKSNGMFFIETSAKTSENVNQLFEVDIYQFCEVGHCLHPPFNL